MVFQYGPVDFGPRTFDMNLIVLAGMPAAGKSSALESIANLGIPAFDSGVVIRELWNRYNPDGSTPSSERLGQFATKQREIHGRGIVGHHTGKYLRDKLDSPDVAAIGGLRSPESVSKLETFAESISIVHIDAPFRVRLNRIQERDRDDEGEFTADDLIDRDNRERSWGTGELTEMADEVIVNWDISEDKFRRISQDLVHALGDNATTAPRANDVDR